MAGRENTSKTGLLHSFSLAVSFTLDFEFNDTFVCVLIVGTVVTHHFPCGFAEKWERNQSQRKDAVQRCKFIQSRKLVTPKITLHTHQISKTDFDYILHRHGVSLSEPNSNGKEGTGGRDKVLWNKATFTFLVEKQRIELRNYQQLAHYTRKCIITLTVFLSLCLSPFIVCVRERARVVSSSPFKHCAAFGCAKAISLMPLWFPPRSCTHQSP